MKIGFLGLLTILFIGLKLTGYINWSWLWGMLPLGFSIIWGLGIFVIYIIAAWRRS